MTQRRRARRPRVGLALAGGGPFGAIYEIGALAALEESIEGLDLAALDCYVGVSAGAFLAAALANGIPVAEVHRLFIADGRGEGAIAPRLFRRPAWREYLRAALERRVPTGLFDNGAIHEYLAQAFTRSGRTNDFRRLRRPLYLVATDLDTGESVSFGRPGHDGVPISKAVQASAALPGLFPPVEIDRHSYVDGALKKTLHASEALDDGMDVVLCVNPIVPFDARSAVRPAGLARGGLPVVLSQSFRALIHSRMALGISKYRSLYRDSDVLLFEPPRGDSEVFFTSVFSYRGRALVCEHAYENTRRDLLRRAPELAPVLAKHGLRLRIEALADPARPRTAPAQGRQGLHASAAELRDTLGHLKAWMAQRGA
jgi:predicted acylesterase/phospholipase RssA